MSNTQADHWDDRYRTVGAESVSWYQDRPGISLQMLDVLQTTPDDSLIDVGGGASTLVDHLLAKGHQDLTVLDMSAAALDVVRARIGTTSFVSWVVANLLDWTPQRRWDVWHDRAVLHFLVEESDRQAYANVLRQAVEPGGAVVIGVFAEDGPEQCSGLPVRRHSVADLRALLPELERFDERRDDHTTPSNAVQHFNWVAGRLPR